MLESRWDSSAAGSTRWENFLTALQRAALAAHKTAIQTNTGIVIQRAGKLLRIPAAELRQSTVVREDP